MELKSKAKNINLSIESRPLTSKSIMDKDLE
jgi:hypothetical protein